jgi:hypothetical protein
MKRSIVFSVLLVLCAASVMAASVDFLGSYSENFNSLGTAGTTMPAGYRALSLAGDSTTFAAGIPITAAAIAGATANSSQTLTVWNPPTDPYSANGNGFRDVGLANAGSIGNTSDRALGTGPTETAGTVIELALKNMTGSSLAAVSLSYDMKVLCQGSAGDESSELPGYAFFYSTDGSTWTASSALSANGYTVGTTYSKSGVITFASAVANGGTVYFRWADDNNFDSSPDQTIAIDNVSVVAVPSPVMSIRISEVEVCWTSVTNAMYRVDYRSSLTTNAWVTLSSCVPSAGGETCITDKVLPGEPQRFYRVVVTNCVP